MHHHYVPQFYLSRWVGDAGKVLRYRLEPNGHVTKTPVSPRGTAFEPNLYKVQRVVPCESHDPQAIEKKFFAPIDNNAALALGKLLREPSALAQEERRAWALFMNSMLHRHAYGVLARDAVVPDVVRAATARWMAQRPDGGRRDRFKAALDHIDLNESAKSAHRADMVDDIGDDRALAVIEGLRWEVVEMNRECAFITTDRPVLVNLGKAHPRVELVTMALSPQKLFVAYPSHWGNPDGAGDDGVCEMLEAVRLAHNLMLLNEQPCRCVYSSQELQEVVAGGCTIKMPSAVESALRRWAELEAAESTHTALVAASPDVPRELDARGVVDEDKDGGSA